MKNVEKISHWIWYVFPQIQGLDWSGTTAYFSVRGLSEAINYYDHPFLSERLIEITLTLLNIETDDPVDVFGYPDVYKVCSYMMLFKYAAPDNNLFHRVVYKFCQGNEDDKTLRELRRAE